jgi:hypothetical protein
VAFDKRSPFESTLIRREDASRPERRTMPQDEIPHGSPKVIPIFNKELSKFIKNYNVQPHIALSMCHILGGCDQVLEDFTASFVVDGADYDEAPTMITVISDALE